MAVLVTYEARLLAGALALIEASAECSENPVAHRWQILEAISARLGGFELERYYKIRNVRTPISPKAVATAAEIITIISAIDIHPTLALASLAQPTLETTERRRTGAFYTDFRLAQFTASGIPKSKSWKKLIVDPACGSGMLLAAAVIKLAGKDRTLAAKLVGTVICGCDTSRHGLRAASLVLSSLTSDERAIRALQKRLVNQDSLLVSGKEWDTVAPHGVRAFIMNPPWERIRATRHEFLTANGAVRHYGHDYTPKQDDGLVEHRKAVRNYAANLVARFPGLAGHEIDFYEAFLSLASERLRDGGVLAAIVPSGLIRSQGTEQLRKRTLASAKKAEISVFDNNQNFFAIDTRFKFLVLKAAFSRSGPYAPIVMSSPIVRGSEIIAPVKVPIGRKALARIRPDLSLPEVRTNDEWRLFRKMAENHDQFSQIVDWRHSFCREVDMTKDRPQFRRAAVENHLPLVEGRMVHQFTSAAKDYVSGTGRRALWQPHIGNSPAIPQFWFPRDRLRASALQCVGTDRVGFCDITGQTNERTMLATVVPSGVVCGNKVPTVQFEQGGRLSAYAFVGIANSFVFDWLLRRIITTTVNYFILDSVPFPLLSPRTPAAARIAQLAEKLSNGLAVMLPWRIAELRAELDCQVLKAYSASLADLELMMADFPLLDRGEPPIPGEPRSTITRDFLMLRASELSGGRRGIAELRNRVAAAKCGGAMPYRSSHLVSHEHLNHHESQGLTS